METLTQPWPWYVAGPLIGLTVPALLLLVGKPFGISSSFRHLASMCSPKTRVAYLRDNDWRGELWSLVFVLGVIIGAFVAAHYLSNSAVHLLPDHYRQWSGGLRLFIGGLFVGFGTRYADGCTSGHSIMGLSNLKWSSLLATACFFIGGMVSIVVLDALFPMP